VIVDDSELGRLPMRCQAVDFPVAWNPFDLDTYGTGVTVVVQWGDVYGRLPSESACVMAGLTLLSAGAADCNGQADDAAAAGVVLSDQVTAAPNGDCSSRCIRVCAWRTTEAAAAAAPCHEC
jgi:hypothetical protein